MYWSILDNPKNQEQAYNSLEFFMDTLVEDIGSDLCMRAVFSNNEYLMKLVPHIHLEELVDKIVQGGLDGKRHEYHQRDPPDYLRAAIPVKFSGGGLSWRVV